MRWRVPDPLGLVSATIAFLLFFAVVSVMNTPLPAAPTAPGSYSKRDGFLHVRVGDIQLAIPDSFRPSASPSRLAERRSFDYAALPVRPTAGVLDVDSVLIELEKFRPAVSEFATNVIAIHARELAAEIDMFCRSLHRTGATLDLAAADGTDGEFSVFQTDRLIGPTYVLRSDKRFFELPIIASRDEIPNLRRGGAGKIEELSFLVALAPNTTLSFRVRATEVPRAKLADFLDTVQRRIESWRVTGLGEQALWFHDRPGGCREPDASRRG